MALDPPFDPPFVPPVDDEDDDEDDDEEDEYSDVAESPTKPEAGDAEAVPSPAPNPVELDEPIPMASPSLMNDFDDDDTTPISPSRATMPPAPFTPDLHTPPDLSTLQPHEVHKRLTQAVTAASEAELDGRYEHAHPHFREAARLARHLDLAVQAFVHEGKVHVCSSILAHSQGDHRGASQLQAEAADLFRKAGREGDAHLADAFCAHFRGIATHREDDLEATIDDRIEAARLFRVAGRERDAIICDGMQFDARARLADRQGDLYEALRCRREAAECMRLGDDESTAIVEEAAAKDLEAQIATASGQFAESIDFRLVAAELWRLCGQERDAIGEEALINDHRAMLSSDPEEKVSYRQEAARLFRTMGDEANALLEDAAGEKSLADLAVSREDLKSALTHAIEAARLYHLSGSDAIAFQVDGSIEDIKARIANAAKDVKGEAAHRRQAAAQYRKGGLEDLAERELLLADEVEFGPLPSTASSVGSTVTGTIKEGGDGHATRVRKRDKLRSWLTRESSKDSVHRTPSVLSNGSSS